MGDYVVYWTGIKDQAERVLRTKHPAQAYREDDIRGLLKHLVEAIDELLEPAPVEEAEDDEPETVDEL